ncbi:MAG: hypothetical protein HYV97_19560 [Bdellovibrio sp.]|nr:hypothetical protein [Bdellovibrio sp.]
MKRKKNLSFILCLLLGITMSSSVLADSDEYGEGTPGAEGTQKFWEAKAKKDQGNIACKKNLCKIFSVTVNGHKFTVSANLGDNYGTNGGGTGTSYNAYYGTDGSGGGTGRQGYGVGVEWEYTHCTKTMNVDESVYRAITTYMKALVNPDGTTNPAFTPAEQTIILFYTTVMQLVKGAACS